MNDNIIQQLDKNTMTSYREVESLYLLIALAQIGKEHWLPEELLAKHFLIEKDSATGLYTRPEFLSHFSITCLLTYIKNKIRYDQMQAFIEDHIVKKLDYMKSHCPNDAETLMLFLDIIVCPYVSDATKTGMTAIFDADPAALGKLQRSNDQWFTAWGNKFDLAKELDAKRSRDVY